MLNASYEPLKIVGWQKAIILWFQGKVEVLEHHDVVVRSVRMTLRIPSIIRLKSYVQVRKKSAVRFSRENIYLRDGYRCQYCNQSFPPKDLTLDHVIPVSRGGRKEWTNIVTACRRCNQKKGNRSPHDAEMPLRTKPAMPQWLPQPELHVSASLTPDSWKVYLHVVGTS
ncbi:MAG TPA: HNH endonuclease [Bdellovibrionales bacterium]|nr:HNH endonuclease [Bdellovibrionales bacterium]